eukprot:8578237-Pyramimonas_sp.AAC.1
MPARSGAPPHSTSCAPPAPELVSAETPHRPPRSKSASGACPAARTAGARAAPLAETGAGSRGAGTSCELEEDPGDTPFASPRGVSERRVAHSPCGACETLQLASPPH